MKEFACLDIILLASGCKVFRHGWLIKLLDTIMLLFIISCYGASLYSTIYLAISEKTKETAVNVLISVMEQYSNEIGGLLFIITIRHNRFNMMHELTSLVAPLSPKQRISLKKHSVFCLFMVIMTIVQEAIFTRFHLQTNSFQNIDQAHKIRDWLKFSNNMNSWLIGGCCIFAFFVKTIKFNEENYFNQLEQNINDLQPDDLPRLVLERDSAINKRRTLIKTFGIIPCFWLLHVLISAPVVALSLSSDVSHFVEKAWTVLPLIYNMIALGLVIYQCDSCGHLTRKRMKDIKMKLFTQRKMETMGLFVDELEKSAEEYFTIWKTITMNRQLYLAFLCTIVTFTILVLQTTKEITGSLPNITVTELSSELEPEDSPLNVSSLMSEMTTKLPYDIIPTMASVSESVRNRENNGSNESRFEKRIPTIPPRRRYPKYVNVTADQDETVAILAGNGENDESGGPDEVEENIGTTIRKRRRKSENPSSSGLY